MTSSLVGSEMCIRDRACTARLPMRRSSAEFLTYFGELLAWAREAMTRTCLLYTSDAADDM
eukprot:3974587-Prorocentrum_lima.AAC.1